MSTYSFNPIYYQITWNQSSPTNYAGLTGTQSGGLDPVTSWQINELVSTTGSQAITGTPLANNSTIIINGTAIQFSSSDNLAQIILRINNATRLTGVVANQGIAGGFLTLQNAPQQEGQPFWIAEGNGTALSTMGLTAGVYRFSPSEVGTAFSSVTTGSNVTVNGINVVFSAGALASAVSQLNAQSTLTGVQAYVAGPYLQLASISGQPWTINSGNAVSNLGHPLGNHGGFPLTIDDSIAKERANMRWVQVLSELGENATPALLGNITRTGNIANVATSTVTFTVAYNRPENVYTVARQNEPNAGNTLVGTAALRRQVARAMVQSMESNRKLFDPTLMNYGAYTDRPNAARIQSVVAASLDTVSNLSIVEGNITVVQIADV